MKIRIINQATVFLLVMSLPGCNGNKNQIQNSKTDSSIEAIFPKGELGAKTNFTGNAYNYSLVANDSTYNTLVGNVYFEKGARSNWHVHPSGQILIVSTVKDIIKWRVRQDKL